MSSQGGRGVSPEELNRPNAVTCSVTQQNEMQDDDFGRAKEASLKVFEYLLSKTLFETIGATMGALDADVGKRETADQE